MTMYNFSYVDHTSTPNCVNAAFVDGGKSTAALYVYLFLAFTH